MTDEGELHWTSRLGLIYTVRRPPVIIDLPTPACRRPAPTITTSGYQAYDEDDRSGIWADRERPPGDDVADDSAGRPPPPVNDEPPPF